MVMVLTVPFAGMSTVKRESQFVKASDPMDVTEPGIVMAASLAQS